MHALRVFKLLGKLLLLGIIAAEVMGTALLVLITLIMGRVVRPMLDSLTVQVTQIGSTQVVSDTHGSPMRPYWAALLVMSVISICASLAVAARDR